MVDTTKCVPELHECADGFRKVDRAWIDQHYPRVAPPIDEPRDDEEERLNREVMELRELERARHANDVYPCPVHNPDLFLRWEAGDWPYRKRSSRRTDDGPGKLAPRSAARLLEEQSQPTQMRADLA